MTLPLISVVVTTKNEEKHIGNCLASIAAQDYPADRLEIIVVDNDSDDKTKEIARKYTDKVFD
ncbi:MAG: glycosyltransferase, partial [Gammaproteobacteria bacterium]